MMTSGNNFQNHDRCIFVPAFVEASRPSEAVVMRPMSVATIDTRTLVYIELCTFRFCLKVIAEAMHRGLFQTRPEKSGVQHFGD